MKVTQGVDWNQPIDLGPILAIGVLAYGGVHDLIRNVISIRSNTKLPFHLCVYDNSERNRTNVKALDSLAGPDLSYIDSGSNVGCSVSRNRVFEFFLKKYPNLKYFAFMDQDVFVHKGWASDMLRVMQTYPKAGIVAWPQANIGKVPVRPDGCVSMVSSCCNMHRVDAVKAVQAKFGEPWDSRFFFYRFDSLFAQRNNQVGYRTYLVMRYYQEGKEWLKQKGGILHPCPNSGIKRNPRWHAIRGQSDKLYRRIKKEEGWTEFDPFI